MRGCCQIREGAVRFLLTVDRFPLQGRRLQVGMGDDEVPDDGLECLRVQRHRCGVYGRNDYARIGDLSRVTAIAPDDTADRRSKLLGVLECPNEIRAHVVLKVTSAD